MSTVRLKNSVFLHIPHCNGSIITCILGNTDLIEFDYKFNIIRPHNHGYKYDKHAMLHKPPKNIKSNPYYLTIPDNSNQFATIQELRDQDKQLHKFTVLNDPINWYKSFWLYNTKYNWQRFENPPYLESGGYADFNIWLDNMIKDDSNVGFYTKYIRAWVDENTKVFTTNSISEIPMTLREYGEKWPETSLELLFQMVVVDKEINDLLVSEHHTNIIKSIDGKYF